MNKKTLVLGASTNPSRYSYLAIQRLFSNKQEVKAVGRKEGEVNGVKINTTKKIFKNIHTITLYLNKKIKLNFMIIF